MAFGAGVWILIMKVSGEKHEAWDSSLYFSAGIPMMCVISLLFGYLKPERAWRWGVMPIVGQCLWLLISQRIGNMLPLGLIFFAILTIPGIIAAHIGAFLARFLKLKDKK